IVKAIGVERDRRARHVSLFNAALNQAADRFAVVSDAAQLREALGGHDVTFGISNPPFLAVPESVKTPDGELVDVETAFPPAGWGGEVGLRVQARCRDVFAS